MTNFLTTDLALRLHDIALERHGGMAGLRDRGAFESAIAQPEATFGGDLLHPGIFEQAAAYLFHLAKNHAFLDGNKRVALACATVFLEMNGYELPAEANDALERLTLAVAEGRADKATIAQEFASYF
ncbi:MAG: death-on-curing protein [Cyanobacteria bacterium RYN_339]|nr:death-on-curing protein [Cyanobacteria bacterium RYN_339]